MSADNWAICPRCKADAKTKFDALVEKSSGSYGLIPVEEFDELRDTIAKGIDEETMRTFREDYEFYGAEDGTVTASYSGHCEKCGCGVDFQHVVEIPGVSK